MLPQNFSVGGSVFISGCRSLAAIPEQWRVRGDLAICGCAALKELPVGLNIERHFSLDGTPVERLPRDVQVGQNLRLQCCSRLQALPDGLRVHGHMLIRRCPVKTLPDGLFVNRKLVIVKAPALTSLGKALRVRGDLIVESCPMLNSIPEGLCVAGDLLLPDCRELSTLPADLEVGGAIEVAGSGIRHVPLTLENKARFRWRGFEVPAAVLFRPESVMPWEILGQRNAELRRIMLERVGLEKVLERAGATVLDRDTDAGGERRLLVIPTGPLQWHIYERSQYLACQCPSTGRQYLLRVPPDMTSCRQAAAWLAGFQNPDDYCPVQET